MKIAVIGAGYVGLVSGVCLADFGHSVTCIDKDERKVKKLKKGSIPIYEPGLKKIVRNNLSAGRLQFDTSAKEAIASADVVFIAVGTPARRGDGHADLSYVFQASEEIAHCIDGFTVIVTKSTVPVGTGDEVENIIKKANPAADFEVVSNPEFLREGAAINDFKRPDRIVVGTDSPRAIEIMNEVYRPLFLNRTPILNTSRRSAELIKYAANAFLATKITFINEIADLCEKVGADVQDISRGIGLDGRIGAKFLHAGPGYGGSCFPKDTLALSRTAEENAVSLGIVNTVIEVNSNRKKKMASKVMEAFGGDVTGKKIAFLGLAFKPNTDDMRDAPSLEIAQILESNKAEIMAYDPKSMKEAKALLPNIGYAADAYEAVSGADAVVILTEWDEFRALDIDKVKALMSGDILIDLRNIYSADDMSKRGLNYISVGRP